MQNSPKSRESEHTSDMMREFTNGLAFKGTVGSQVLLEVFAKKPTDNRRSQTGAGSERCTGHSDHLNVNHIKILIRKIVYSADL